MIDISSPFLRTSIKAHPYRSSNPRGPTLRHTSPTKPHHCLRKTTVCRLSKFWRTHNAGCTLTTPTYYGSRGDDLLWKMDDTLYLIATQRVGIINQLFRAFVYLNMMWSGDAPRVQLCIRNGVRVFKVRKRRDWDERGSDWEFINIYRSILGRL